MEGMTKRIREILMNHWDPIGIKQLPEAQGEYDLYVPDVEVLLSKRASAEVISEYLVWVEQERMGLTLRDNERISEATNELLKLISPDLNK